MIPGRVGQRAIHDLPDLKIVSGNWSAFLRGGRDHLYPALSFENPAKRASAPHPMKISKAILPFSAFSCLSVSLNAATILNPSFEANVNPDLGSPPTTPAGRFSFGEEQDFPLTGITGWTAVTTQNGNATNDGSERSVGYANITPAAGAQVLSLMSGASASQFTSVSWSSLNVGDTITMTVAIGDRTSVNPPLWADQSFFGIIDNTVGSSIATLRSTTVANSGELVTPFSGGTGINSGTMQDRSFSYTVVAGDLSRSGTIGVLLAAYGTQSTTGDLTGLTPNNTNQAFFDNVRLDIVAVPEPSAALLGGLGLLAVLRRRRN